MCFRSRSCIRYESQGRRPVKRLATLKASALGSPIRAVFACWGGDAKPEGWVKLTPVVKELPQGWKLRSRRNACQQAQDG
jgi:hypothetical protein